MEPPVGPFPHFCEAVVMRGGQASGFGALWCQSTAALCPENPPGFSASVSPLVWGFELGR